MAEPKPRFELAAVTELESRDGGISKGGLIKNGFLEKDVPEGFWLWQRPALQSSVAAPLVGNGLGLYLVGTTLWGMIAVGTATSYLVQSTSTGTAYTLLASNVGGIIGVGYDPAGGTYYQGSLSVPVWNGGTVGNIYSEGTTLALRLTLFGTHGTSAFQYVRVRTSTYGMNQITGVSTGGADPSGYTNFDWSFNTAAYPKAFSSAGTYSGSFK